VQREAAFLADYLFELSPRPLLRRMRVRLPVADPIRQRQPKAPVAAQGSWKCRGRGAFVDEWTALGDSGCEHAGEAVADARGSVARHVARSGGRGWGPPDDRPPFMRARL